MITDHVQRASHKRSEAHCGVQVAEREAALAQLQEQVRHVTVDGGNTRDRIAQLQACSLLDAAPLMPNVHPDVPAAAAIGDYQAIIPRI